MYRYLYLSVTVFLYTLRILGWRLTYDRYMKIMMYDLGNAGRLLVIKFPGIWKQGGFLIS